MIIARRAPRGCDGVQDFRHDRERTSTHFCVAGDFEAVGVNSSWRNTWTATGVAFFYTWLETPTDVPFDMDARGLALPEIDAHHQIVRTG